jgi:hypothetical protein
MTITPTERAAILHEYHQGIGKKGGEGGTGKSKVRGGVEYYKKISKLAVEARARNRAKREGKSE